MEIGGIVKGDIEAATGSITLLVIVESEGIWIVEHEVRRCLTEEEDEDGKDCGEMIKIHLEMNMLFLRKCQLQVSFRGGL